MRRDWGEDAMLGEEELPRERDTDSSRQAEYEDSVLPDREWEHEETS